MDNVSRIRAFDFNLTQLDRVQDLGILGRFQIIHIQYDDLTDHYVTLLECDDAMANWISLF
jgi:hypothetical protein